MSSDAVNRSVFHSLLCCCRRLQLAGVWASERHHERRAGRPGRGQPAAGPGRRPHEPQGHRPGPGLPAGAHPVPGPRQPSGRLLRPAGEFAARPSRCLSSCRCEADCDWIMFPGDPVPGRMSSQSGDVEGRAGDDAEPPERYAEVSLSPARYISR